MRDALELLRAAEGSHEGVVVGGVEGDPGRDKLLEDLEGRVAVRCALAGDHEGRAGHGVRADLGLPLEFPVDVEGGREPVAVKGKGRGGGGERVKGSAFQRCMGEAREQGGHQPRQEEEMRGPCLTHRSAFARHRSNVL